MRNLKGITGCSTFYVLSFPSNIYIILILPDISLYWDGKIVLPDAYDLVILSSRFGSTLQFSSNYPPLIRVSIPNNSSR
jgi:hypothetical protein